MVDTADMFDGQAEDHLTIHVERGDVRVVHPSDGQVPSTEQKNAVRSERLKQAIRKAVAAHAEENAEFAARMENEEGLNGLVRQVKQYVQLVAAPYNTEDVSGWETVEFGRYQYGEYQHRGGSVVPLVWRVLDSRPTGRLLLCDTTIGHIPYEDVDGATTWAKCALRKWLNARPGAWDTPSMGSVSVPGRERNEFWDWGEGERYWPHDCFLARFTPKELGQIQPITVSTPDVGWAVSAWNERAEPFIMPGGDDIECRVFVLSASEVSIYLPEPATRIPQGGGRWWLRSPGDGEGLVACVLPSGRIDQNGERANSAGVEVRPALWLRPES